MKEAVSKKLFSLLALPPEGKSKYSGLHDAMFKDMESFFTTAVTTSNPTKTK
jgi:hypothetical protein